MRCARNRDIARNRTKEGACAFLFALALAGPAAGDVLTATRSDGTEIARIAIAPGEGWCVVWNHSVAGFRVSDCYENRGGAMVLVSSHQPDFAAGLGHIIGRGTQISDGNGGYLIIGIDAPVPQNSYILRPGAGAVDHRLQTATQSLSLSALAARDRVTIRLTQSEAEND